MLHVDPHPLLAARAFAVSLPRALGELTASPALEAALSADGAAAGAPFAPPDDALRGAVRDLLRHGGYKPTGRGKPSSEYLLRAVQEGGLPRINLLVDACNAVSLHSGLPISVVDLDRAATPLRIGIAPEDATYVFNASGQTIDLGGLLCLFDAEGPCANAVKDAQRTKTHADTRRALVVVWAPASATSRGSAAEAWYRALLEASGAETESVPPAL
jgi:DNA/RNA-binding domain of Phe-tRNA-synthetase-like protein